jgi:hypothetical protein
VATAGAHRLVVAQVNARFEAVVEASRNGSWQVIQRWPLRSGVEGTTRSRRQELETTAAEFGWSLPAGRWPHRNRAGRQVVALTPVDWYTILSKATAYRRSRIEEFIAMDQAWRHVLVDAVTVGALGPSGAAGAADITRWRVYQILKDPVSTELVKIAEATAQQRQPRRRATTTPEQAATEATTAQKVPALEEAPVAAQVAVAGAGGGARG